MPNANRKSQRWQRLGALALAVAIIAALVGGGLWASDALLPHGSAVARGVVFGGEVADPREGAKALVFRRAQALQDHRIVLSHEGKKILDTTAGMLGLQIDKAELEGALLDIARKGSPWRRLHDGWRARKQELAVKLRTRLPVQPLIERLRELKAELDRAPTPARWDFAEERAIAHRPGARLDLYLLAEKISAGIAHGEHAFELSLTPVLPAATTDVVRSAERSVIVAQQQTRFADGGNQSGRAQNVHRAARGINGLVLMPGEVQSFNSIVGPRSIENGFAHAGEIYRGEMRRGVGGGTCQVASTFHAAAYLGGLEVVERSPHSRPSGYIGVGMDATVAYPHVDLKLRNGFDFPIIVKAEVLKGGILAVALLGKERPARVEIRASVVGARSYKRKVRRASWLEEGRIIRKQKGIVGRTVAKTRVIELPDGTREVQKTIDIYPPTTEIYLLAPDVDEAAALPPLPGAR